MQTQNERIKDSLNDSGQTNPTEICDFKSQALNKLRVATLIQLSQLSLATKEFRSLAATERTNIARAMSRTIRENHLPPSSVVEDRQRKETEGVCQRFTTKRNYPLPILQAE